MPRSTFARVDVSVNGGPFSAAAGTSVWAFAVDVPSSGSVLPINVRSFDAVDNTNSASFNLTLDDTSPTLTVNLAPGEVRTVRRNADGNWTLHLTGTATDALAGMDSLTLQVGVSANRVITPTGLSTTAWPRMAVGASTTLSTT